MRLCTGSAFLPSGLDRALSTEPSDAATAPGQVFTAVASTCNVARPTPSVFLRSPMAV